MNFRIVIIVNHYFYFRFRIGIDHLSLMQTSLISTIKSKFYHIPGRFSELIFVV